MAALLLTAGGCAKESARTPLVRIAAQIESRATALNFETGDCIGLDIVRTSEHYAANEPLTYDGTGFVSASLQWYADRSDAATLTAYYPYAAGGRPDRFTVAADQSQGLESSDLLAARKTQVTPSASAVAMTFRHLLLRLVIHVENTTDAEIGTLELAGLTGTATIDWEALTATASGEALTITPCKTTASDYLAILVPQEGTLSVGMVLQNGRRETQSIPVRLESGKSYNLSLSLTEAGLQVTVSGDITDWVDGGDPTVSGGTGDTPPTTPTDPDTGGQESSEQLTIGSEVYALRTIGGKLWMAENLRTIPDGKSVGNGCWNPYANGEEAPEQATARGYLYDYETAKKCCPTGWHLPTKAELEALIGANTGAGFFTAAGFWRSGSGMGSYDDRNYLLGESVGGDECVVLLFTESGGGESTKELDAENGYSVRFVKD